MKDSPIQIGSINLQNFEVPPSIRFGGRHRLAVHLLSSGRRVVERLGPEDGEIVFRGTFSGADAEARVQMFDNLRLSGEIVWLTWESFRRRVVVKSFVVDYHSPWWIFYQVHCTVVHQAGVPAPHTSILRTLVSADLSSALSAATGSALQLSPLTSSFSRPNTWIAGTSDQSHATDAVRSTLATIDGEIARQSSFLVNPTDHGRITDPQADAMAATVNW